jgi:hypothetical protein
MIIRPAAACPFGANSTAELLNDEFIDDKLLNCRACSTLICYRNITTAASYIFNSLFNCEKQGPMAGQGRPARGPLRRPPKCAEMA